MLFLRNLIIMHTFERASQSSYMFFFSAPSLVIYTVLAVCYLANLAFYTVNSQPETKKPVEIVVDNASNRLPLSPLSFHIQHDAAKNQHKDCQCYQGICHSCYFEYIVIDDDVSNCYSYNHTNLATTRQGILHQLFFRPPPRV